MSEPKPTNSIPALRAAVRPMLLWMMTLGTFALIWQGATNGLDLSGDIGTFIKAWVGLTMAANGEWILERPILKAFGKA